MIVIVLLHFLPSGCMNRNKHELIVKELLELDIEFSLKSAESRSPTAFIAYIDDHCVLLRPNRQPVVGREKILEMFSQPDTSFILTWEPSFAEVSKSGDLGYTYGTFRVSMDSPEGIKVSREGTYVTIWKKNDKGEWKFVLDTGNQGLGSLTE